jgi:alpha-glucosidase
MDKLTDALNWSLGTVVYHVYVRSFMDSNGDGIGDLQGLISKIDYIASLGCNAIWLSPVYTSPQADFGYDIANYTDIDPQYGKLSDFDELISAAHTKGIKIMMDYVPNHTSDKHKWFLESKNSHHNPKRDWYIWAKGKAEGPPNNWLSVFGGSAWEYDGGTDEYYLHTFEKGQPDINWRNPDVVAAMLSVLRFWMDRGVDGFRVDVPYHMFKNAELLNEPANPGYNPSSHGEYESLLHIYTGWLPESFAMMTRFVGVLQEYKNKFMVSEAWGSMEDIIKLYRIVGWKYYAPFNFSLLTLPWRADVHKKYIDSFDKELRNEYIPCYVLGNHDRPRVASRIGEAQARIAAILEITLRGLPFIYYGEEIAMTDTNIAKDAIQDPFEKLSPGLGLGRDPQRTPMQWNSQAFAGFSTAETWLPVNQSFPAINVRAEEKDRNSMLTMYKLLIKLRKHHPSLREGNYIPLPHPAENIFAFIRESIDEKILILLNFDEKVKPLSLAYRGKVLLSTAGTVNEDSILDLHEYQLSGNEGTILLLTN